MALAVVFLIILIFAFNLIFKNGMQGQILNYIQLRKVSILFLTIFLQPSDHFFSNFFTNGRFYLHYIAFYVVLGDRIYNTLIM